MGKHDCIVTPIDAGFALYDDLTRNEIATYSSADEAIQQALDTAAENGGGCVRLTSGTFSIDRPLQMGTRCSLSGSGPSTQIIVQGSAGMILRNIGQATVRDLRLRAGASKAQAGVVLDAAGSCTVDNISAERFVVAGVHMCNGSFLNRISNSSLLGNKKTGLYAQNLAEGRAGDYISNQIENCTVAGGGKGMEFDRAIVFNVVGCSCYHTTGMGFHLHNDSNSISIVGSRTFQITGSAVVVECAHEFNCTGNIFCWSTGHGIVLRQTNWGTVSGNNIIDSGSFNTGTPNFHSKRSDVNADFSERDGIRLEMCRGYAVTGNALFNWSVCPPMDVAIREDDECSDNVITGNNANYFKADAPVSSTGLRSVATNNHGWPDTPFNSYERLDPDGWLQSFRTEVTERCIDGEWEIDARNEDT